jgi:hypothetical protein
MEALTRNDIIIHCYYGGENNPQALALAAIRLKLCAIGVDNYVRLEMKNTDDIKSQHWTEENLVDWLAEADIYLIACHPHQGAHRSWSPVELYLWIERKLTNRIGFPRGDALMCPIFVQDKINYLNAVPHLTLPTLPIYLKHGNDYTSDIENIKR